MNTIQISFVFVIMRWVMNKFWIQWKTKRDQIYKNKDIIFFF